MLMSFIYSVSSDIIYILFIYILTRAFFLLLLLPHLININRGQPITTSAGKWLQLMLTISDVVDLSRFRFDLTYRVVRADTGNLSPSTSAAVSANNGSGGGGGGGGGGNAGGGSGAILWYGDPVPGTLCSRNLHSCDQRTCILQSPNFPGLYPR